MKLTKAKAKYFMKDEKKASKQYKKLKLKKLSKDEKSKKIKATEEISDTLRLSTEPNLITKASIVNKYFIKTIQVSSFLRF